MLLRMKLNVTKFQGLVYFCFLKGESGLRGIPGTKGVQGESVKVRRIFSY